MSWPAGQPRGGTGGTGRCLPWSGRGRRGCRAHRAGAGRAGLRPRAVWHPPGRLPHPPRFLRGGAGQRLSTRLETRLSTRLGACCRASASAVGPFAAAALAPSPCGRLIVEVADDRVTVGGPLPKAGVEQRLDRCRRVVDGPQAQGSPGGDSAIGEQPGTEAQAGDVHSQRLWAGALKARIVSERIAELHPRHGAPPGKFAVRLVVTPPGGRRLRRTAAAATPRRPPRGT